MNRATHTRQELEQIEEYARRLAAGLNPDPLVEKIPLEAIAGLENVSRVSQIEHLDHTSKSVIRGNRLTFVTTSKRLLWQAYGQEHIEPELLNFIDQIPGDATYFDIGASNGIFALYAASRSIRVMCFEPEAGNFSLLNHNTYLNHQKFKHHVCNFNVALSDVTGIGAIFIEKFEPGGHLKILDSETKRGHKKFKSDFKQAVLKYKLDDFIELTGIAVPNYIKIDVDGAEQQVLRGMPRSLGDTNLRKIFIELEESGENFNACHHLLVENGFKIESKKRVQNYFGEENFVYTR